jgi:ABC-type bacteriocin/lantibiotic exporter with double-glycine peptidase domain
MDEATSALDNKLNIAESLDKLRLHSYCTQIEVL